MLTEATSTNSRHGAASNIDDESVHEDRAIYTTTYRNQDATRHSTATDRTVKDIRNTSSAARSRTATNQQVTEHMINNLPSKAHLRLLADPILGCGGSNMKTATPQNRRTLAYGATRHGMNTACVNGRREHRQLPRQVCGIMIMMSVVAESGVEDVHDMIAIQTYQQDKAHTTANKDVGADMAHIICVQPSSRQRQTASGVNTATLHFRMNTAHCNNNYNDRPR